MSNMRFASTFAYNYVDGRVDGDYGRTVMSNPRNFKRINYALAGTLIASGVTLEKVAEQVGAKNSESLRVGLAKKGVTVTKARAKPFEQAVTQSVTLKLATAAAEQLKEMVGNNALRAAAQLSKAKVGTSSAKIKGFVDALEPLSRVGDRLYGWNQAAGPSWGVVVLDRQTPQPDQLAMQ